MNSNDVRGRFSSSYFSSRIEVGLKRIENEIFNVQIQTGYDRQKFKLVKLPEDSNWLSYLKFKLARSVVDEEVLQAQMSTSQLVSDDPECMMYCKVLGPNAVKVSVTMAILPATPLWSSTDDTNTIGEALNGFIAWPKDLIAVKDD
ncbi:hypothetical protein GIB67_020881 [Kingdonia uniflora]|uniref:DUF8039 domain-containing protein n=1 Tax=Kingdonia uniflora TaxID=39325 RepID=A0A7J7M7S2_9MAGN|nr:hypothetical protein GIB67_020881 [Kingdonia uniflora]